MDVCGSAILLIVVSCLLRDSAAQDASWPKSRGKTRRLVQSPAIPMAPQSPDDTYTTFGDDAPPPPPVYPGAAAYPESPPQISYTFPPMPGGLGLGLFIPANTAEIRVDLAKARDINASMWGAYLPEADHAGEGGLYAELVKDRSFDALATRFAKPPLTSCTLGRAWLALPSARWRLERSVPLGPNNTVFLRVSVPTGKTSGVVNQGYNGIAVVEGGAYYASLWARCVEGACGALTVSLVSPGGNATYGALTLPPPSHSWQKFAGMVTSNGTDPAALLSVTFDGAATVDLDVVSLFPGANYVPQQRYLTPFRDDLLQAVKGLKPRFIQILQFNWKSTIAPMEQRPGHLLPNGSYWNTDGMGLFEYMLLCDAVGAQPVWLIPAGDAPTAGAGAFDWVQDTLDLLEFVMGPPNSPFGKVRASLGRYRPWSLTRIVLGSVNPFCSLSNPYFYNYPLLSSKVRARWAAVRVVTRCRNVRSGYSMYSVQLTTPYPDKLWDFQTAFDDPSLRSIPPAVVTDFSIKSGDGDLRGALSEAAFMMGMERNADVVALSTFYPLLGSLLDRGHPSMAIKFDNTRLFGTPSFYVQQIFSQYHSTQALSTTLTLEDGTAPRYLTASATCSDNACGTIYVKMVNFDMMPRSTTIDFANAGPLHGVGQLLVLTGANAYDSNSLETPTAVAPQASEVAVAASMRLQLQPYSFTLLTVTAL